MNQLHLFEKENKDNHTAEAYTGIYGLHKYWSKKPHNIIRKFITRYSNKNDIVLDPFCGSGVSVLEAIFTQRKAVGIDINPSAVFITEQLLKKIPIDLIHKEFERLESNIKAEIDSLYQIRRGSESYVGSHFIWENGQLLEVWYQDKTNGKVVEEPTKEDIDFANSFSYEGIPFFYPKGTFFHNPRINAKRDKYIYELFTPRNLMALSLLLDRIEKITNKDARDLFRFIFTSAMGQASKMVFVVKRRGIYKESKTKRIARKEVGSWVIGYWVPKENFEINVWRCFENRFKKTIRAKGRQLRQKYEILRAKCFQELAGDKNLLLINEPAQKVLSDIPDDSIDYVVTDPPHGNRQPYLELSMMWNEWLKKQVKYDDEIVISESKERSKDVDDYFTLLNIVMEEVVRVLKPNRFFSLMFNSLDDVTWINLMNNISKLNLEIEKVETLSYSANSVVQDTRDKGLKTDFIITFKKTTNRIPRYFHLISTDAEKQSIIDLIKTYLSDSQNQELETYQVFNLLFSDLFKSGKFVKLSDVLNILKTHFQKTTNKWTMKIPNELE